MLGMICGDGELPLVTATYLLQSKSDFIAICFDEKNFLILKEKITRVYYLQCIDISTIFNIIKKYKIRTVTLCGGVKFHGLQSIKYPWHKLHYIILAMLTKNKGDNTLLNIAAKLLRSVGCKVLGVNELVPNLVARQSDTINPDSAAKYSLDIELGINTLTELSKLDIGQAVVIQNGRILGIEGAEGTDELIKRCGNYAIKGIKTTKPILVKIPKINQNMQIDLPTIGIQTINNLISYDYAGIAIKNLSTILLNRDEVHNAVKASAMFLKIV